jgi:hypothetical protein
MIDLFGIQIVETESLVDTHSRVRPWKERLFSWPWKPWVKIVVWQTPSETIYLVDMDAVGKRFICHPAMAEMIKQTATAPFLPEPGARHEHQA